MARKPSAALELISALGVLGRRFEPSRPDSNNPSHRVVFQPVFFCWLKYDIFVFMSYLCHMPVFAKLFADILSSLIYFFKDKHFKDRLIIFTERLCEGFGVAFPLFFLFIINLWRNLVL